MSSDALSRDARHLALAQVGPAGQQSIADGAALLIGVKNICCERQRLSECSNAACF
ncbi:MAG: hypothetical protein IIC12_06400 [Proteobacteria bacterium]|nr:hypothetical protein [Pseudomonadota bacterium]